MLKPRPTTVLSFALISSASLALLTFIKQSTDPTTRNPNEIASCAALRLPTPALAQASQVHLQKSFLSPHEIKQIVTFAEQVQREKKVGVVRKDGKGTESASYSDTVWTTSYLHTNSEFSLALPKIAAKILSGLRTADREQFHILKDAEEDHHVNLRTVEYHEYVPGGSLQEKLHYDAGSCITIDVLLEDEFEGGEISFPEVDGTTTVLGKDAFQIGDAAFFVSHKFHNVRPVTAGLRKVLVAELWRGPTKTCPHRCKTLDKCTYSLTRNHMEQSRENLSILG